MLLLLVFIAISVVYCQDCPVWSTLENNPALLEDLDTYQTFYKVLASGANTSNVADCQVQTYTIEDDNIENVYLQSSDWCRQLTDCTATEDYYECDLVFLAPTPAPSPVTTRTKLVDKIVEGINVCLVVSYCRDAEEGLSVLCSEQPSAILTLLLQVIAILTTLLDGLLEVPAMEIINHSECDFQDTCPPS